MLAPIRFRGAFILGFVATVASAQGLDVSAWSRTTDFPVAGYQFDPVEHNGYIYVVGGWTGGPPALDTVYFARIKADGFLGPWAATTPFPEPDQGPGVTVWNGQIYVGMGNGNVYRAAPNPDGTLGPWIAETAAAPNHGGRLLVEAYNGCLYILGGFGPGCLHHDEVYFAPIQGDGSLGSWGVTTPLPQPQEHMSVHFYDDRVYIVGGVTSCNVILDSSYSAPVNPNCTLGSWRQEADLATPLWLHSSVLAGNELYLFGGRTLYGNGGYVYDIQRGVIDPSTGVISAWEDVGDLPQTDGPNAIGALYVESNGEAYLIGGCTPTCVDQVWTTAQTNVPTISGWGLLITVALLLSVATIVLRRRQVDAVLG